MKAIVYSGPACSWCERVKVLLEENEYEIEEKSIINKENVEEFQNKLGCTETFNIGKDGTSFPRTLRSTVEWVAQNGNPEFAVILITYAHRWEMAIAKQDDNIDGTWHPVLEEPHLRLDKIDLSMIPEDKFKKLVSYYHGCVPNIRTYWDKIFTDIILLASFFEKFFNFIHILSKNGSWHIFLIFR